MYLIGVSMLGFLNKSLLLVAILYLGVPILRAAEGRNDSGLVVVDDFSKGADQWQPTDPSAWKVVKTDHGAAYSLTKLSNFKPPQRSPLGMSLLKDVIVGDFTLRVEAQSTKKEYPHQDLCLFFGYQDPSHFYYAHLARKTDDHANQIFIVNGADRAKISTKTTEGTVWGTGWHNLKLIRKPADGTIEVYFDDMQAPVMTATDKTFTWGQVGLGSFDDTANFANFKLSGNRAKIQSNRTPSESNRD
jgi:hypothetical protein